jgi:hypothetical protein
MAEKEGDGALSEQAESLASQFVATLGLMDLVLGGVGLY